ncbi:MAG: sigma-54-dependent transcriptional regulator, partial [bacterium]
MNSKILVVDDEDLIRESLEDTLQETEEYSVYSVSSGEEAQQVLQRESIRVMVTDLKMEEISGMELLKWTQENSPLTETIVITAHGSIENAVEAMKQGAFNYLPKPFSPETVEAEIARALEHRELRARNQALQSQIESRQGEDKIVGDSPAMEKIYSRLESITNADVPVLISGETGTGKELVARRIHRESSRRSGNFVVVDCGTLPENIMESELFGHKKGAFTGAYESKTGKFELADGGTLFLDEIGNLPPEMQAKLLRFLQHKEFTPLGSTKPRTVDTRVLAATNIKLEEAIETGEFREDLYYRLNVMKITLPPLRKRKEDIPALASYFLRQYAPDINPEVEKITQEAIRRLESFDWPGNVRELENCIQHSLAVADGDKIKPCYLPGTLKEKEVEV